MIPRVSVTEKLKELGGHTFIYGLSSSLQASLGFILLPLYTKYYTPEQFGIFSLLTLLSTLLGLIFNLGSTSALSRFYFEEEGDKHKNRIFNSAIILICCGAILLSVLSFLIAKPLSLLLFQQTKYYQEIEFALIASATTNVLNAFLLRVRLMKESLFFLFLNVLLASASTALIFVFFHCTFLESVLRVPFVSFIIANIITTVFILFYKKIPVIGMDLSTLTQLLRFGLISLLAGVFYYILDWVDRFFINEYLGTAQVGIYSYGYKIGMVIHILFIIPFSMIWSTIRMEYAKNNDKNEFVKMVITYYTIGGLFIVVFLSIFSKELLYLLSSNPDYYQAYKITPIILLAHLMYGYQNILDFGIYVTNKIYLYSIVFFVAIIFNVVCNYLFIEKFGITAAAFISLLTYCLSSGLIYFFSSKNYTMPIDVKRVVGIFLMGVIVIGVSFINEVSFMPTLQTIGLKLVVILLYILSTYLFILNDLEKYRIRNVFIKRGFTR